MLFLRIHRFLNSIVILHRQARTEVCLNFHSSQDKFDLELNSYVYLYVSIVSDILASPTSQMFYEEHLTLGSHPVPLRCDEETNGTEARRLEDSRRRADPDSDVVSRANGTLLI